MLGLLVGGRHWRRCSSPSSVEEVFVFASAFVYAFDFAFVFDFIFVFAFVFFLIYVWVVGWLVSLEEV